jgi:hypothetical protein
LPPSVLSVLSVPTIPVSKTFAPSTGTLLHDPTEWREPFARWLGFACVISPRCFGGVVCLHIAYSEWEVRQGGVPCTRDTFERLLTERGFLVGEVAGVVLVSGLILKDDWLAHERFQNPALARTAVPARHTGAAMTSERSP